MQQILTEAGSDTRLLPIGIPDQFVEHGSVNELRQMLKIDAESIAEKIIEEYQRLERET